MSLIETSKQREKQNNARIKKLDNLLVKWDIRKKFKSYKVLKNNISDFRYIYQVYIIEICRVDKTIFEQGDVHDYNKLLFGYMRNLSEKLGFTFSFEDIFNPTMRKILSIIKACQVYLDHMEMFRAACRKDGQNESNKEKIARLKQQIENTKKQNEEYKHALLNVKEMRAKDNEVSSLKQALQLELKEIRSQMISIRTKYQKSAREHQILKEEQERYLREKQSLEDLVVENPEELRKRVQRSKETSKRLQTKCRKLEESANLHARLISEEEKAIQKIQTFIEQANKSICIRKQANNLQKKANEQKNNKKLLQNKIQGASKQKLELINLRKKQQLELENLKNKNREKLQALEHAKIKEEDEERKHKKRMNELQLRLKESEKKLILMRETREQYIEQKEKDEQEIIQLYKTIIEGYVKYIEEMDSRLGAIIENPEQEIRL